MKSNLLLILIFFVIFSSNAQKSFKSPNVSPKKVRDIAVFEPISFINLVYKGDNAIYSDSLSRISLQLWFNSLELNRYRLPIENYIVVDNEFNRKKIQEETKYLFEEIEALDQFYSIPVPPTIKKQLELSGNRFGMLTLTSGFTRNRGNLTGQIFKSLGIGLLTMGGVMIIPETAQSNVFVLILDNDLDEVVYYNASISPEKKPLKQKTLHNQLDYLFQGYFWH